MDDDVFDTLLTHLHAQAPSSVVDLLTPGERLNCAHDMLQTERARCTDMDAAAQFAKGCPTPQTTPSDYLNRVLIHKDQMLLTGIRFRGGDLTFPFVDIVASSPLAPSALDTATLSFVLEAYQAFSPKAIRVLSANKSIQRREHPSLATHGWRINTDQVFAASAVSSMKPPHGRPSIKLVPVADCEAAASFVKQVYIETFEQSPELREALHPADEEDLRVCANTGHLVWLVNDTNTACGLIGTYKDNAPLFAGQCVMEEVVSLNHRGQGVAAEGQRLLAQRIGTSSPDTILWGTIDATNTASRRTAQRAGRDEVLSWLWLMPPDMS